MCTACLYCVRISALLQITNNATGEIKENLFEKIFQFSEKKKKKSHQLLELNPSLLHSHTGILSTRPIACSDGKYRRK